MSIDLHVHTNASDGTLAPAEVVLQAARLELVGIAITDHDSVDGVSRAIEAAAGTGVIVVPALELSATVGQRDMHILGYRIDFRNPTLLSRLAEFRTRRRARAGAMIQALRGSGYNLGIEDVARLADGGAIGRAHIARALAEAGMVATPRQAFAELIGKDSPCYVPKPSLSPEEVIALIREACGIPVLAHPGVSHVDDLIGPLQDAGLRGIEVYHTEHSPKDILRYASIARGRGLLVTGGSDYHGPGGGGGKLGGVEVPDELLVALLEASRVE